MGASTPRTRPLTSDPAPSRPRRRAVLSALAATPAAALLAGCGSESSSSGGKTLRYAYWGSSDRAALIDSAVRLFEKDHPGITVKTSFAGFDSYWQKITTAAAGGNPPDVLQMDYAYIHAMGDHGVLADLTPRTGAGKEIDTSTIRPELRGVGKVGGKYWAIPLALNSLAFMYDPVLYREAGARPPGPDVTWEEFIHESAKVTRHTRGKQYGMTDPCANYQGLEVWLQQRGKALFTSSGQLAFEPSDLRTYLRFAQRWRESGGVNPPSVINDTLPGTPIGAKRAAALLAWDNGLGGYVAQRGSGLQMAGAPTDNGVSGLYPKASMLISASDSTPHLHEAAQLINFMVNDLRVAKILQSNLGMPPTTVQEPVADGYQDADKQIRDFETAIVADQVKTPPPPPASGAAFNTYYARVYEKLAFHRMSVDDAVKQIFQQAEVILT